MSRTYKDRPSKVKFNTDWETDRLKIEYQGACLDYYTGEPREYTHYVYIQTPTTKPKQRKAVDTQDHWMSTPSWWIHTCMTKPQRRKGSLWEREALKTQLAELDEIDKPSVSRKPHIYYW